MSRLYLGTSGFAYAEWKGEFYPADLKSDAMLRYYAERFPSVEINYTFQRHPTEKMLGKWIADTPEGFVFALKANRAITHMWRLKPTAAPALEEFFTSIHGLGARTGPILFQCAPNWKADVGVLREFLTLLPHGRYAFEFRHESCRGDEFLATLAERNAAWVVADADDYDAPVVRTASDFTYLRLRKQMYEAEELARWAKQIAEIQADGSDVYCYFKHEDESRGVRFAQALRDMLEKGSS
jgi:uncharacterized protein YecE (DUF72 family)